MRIRRWRFAVVACAAAFTLPAWADGPAPRTVTDMTGQSVVLPAEINRVAEQFPMHTVTDILLGVGDRLVAIPQNIKTIPLLRKVYPRIDGLPDLFRNGGSVNMEELLKLRPDLVSAVRGGVARKPFETAGLPSVVMSFERLDQLGKSIELAGAVYGGDAEGRARTYVAYLDTRLSLVRSRLANLPDAQRPSVLHIASFPPLVVDGGPSVIGDWIRLAGGRDAAASVVGPHVGITAEQLLQWDPEVLIVETPGGDQGLAANSAQSVLEALGSIPGWRQLRAVKAGRVYANPQGLGAWDRYGPEEALQIQWAAKLLHPELFRDLDIRAVTREFYRTFFGYTLSEAELDQIFQGGA